MEGRDSVRWVSVVVVVVEDIVTDFANRDDCRGDGNQSTMIMLTFRSLRGTDR